MAQWNTMVTFIGNIPPGAWAATIVAILTLNVATLSAARRRVRHAGARSANPELVAAKAEKRRDTTLTVAALLPAGLFWAMVMAGSYHGLVAFGRTTLGWRDGWEFLVPGTLDGVSVAFAFLAFRALRKHKSPDRATRVVWGAALASATVNFSYEYSRSDHNLVAGGYLALLSVFGMVMLHEFLDQFEEGTAYVRRSSPRFGLRWLTWPTNTFCAAVAWRNYPPAEGTPATVRAAVANLEEVRAHKQSASQKRAIELHTKALEATRRRAELQRAKTPAAPRPDPIEAIPAPRSTNHDELPPANTASTPAELRLPQTADTAAQWIQCWMAMVADGLSTGPLSNGMEAQFKQRYGWGVKQLRYVKRAAVTGELRRQAHRLGVDVPVDFVDNPASRQRRGRRQPALSTT